MGEEVCRIGLTVGIGGILRAVSKELVDQRAEPGRKGCTASDRKKLV